MRYKIIIAMVLLAAAPAFGDSDDAAEAKQRGVAIEVVQLEHAEARARALTAENDKLRAQYAAALGVTLEPDYDGPVSMQNAYSEAKEQGVRVETIWLEDTELATSRLYATNVGLKVMVAAALAVPASPAVLKAIAVGTFVNGMTLAQCNAAMIRFAQINIGWPGNMVKVSNDGGNDQYEWDNDVRHGTDKWEMDIFTGTFEKGLLVKWSSEVHPQ